MRNGFFLVHEDVTWIDKHLNQTFVGRLRQFENQNVLEEIKTFKIEAVGKHKAMLILKHKKISCTPAKNARHLMPMILLYLPNEQRIKISPSKILYFLRYNS